jgi:RNA polymerase sigma-70 factor (ECF subfamily)
MGRLALARDLASMSDAALVSAMVPGTEAALDELYRRHAPFVRAVARRPLPSDDLAEEATQDVFLQLWSAPERYDPALGSLRSFLQVLARRRAIDVQRSESSRRRREDTVAQERVHLADPEEMVIELAAARQVRGAMSGLSVPERQAIELAYFGGHSYRQVALLLGQPEGTVKNRIRAGLGRLRRSLRPVLRRLPDAH